MNKSLKYYFWATYHRKKLDELQEKHKRVYKGIVLDIGGRDRGRFNKPRDKVKKWIFADIEKKHNPDLVLDVAKMKGIKSQSIDVISAIELFEHVEEIDKGLDECYRVLKKGGILIISVPFLFPIHADPYDFQRWTEYKWRKKLTTKRFQVNTFEITGRFFTVYCGMIKTFIKSFPSIFRYVGYLLYPLLDLIVKADNTKLIKNHYIFNKYHDGYFIIAKK
ncbi:TPA: class I SAM-dependent methyltransferase [Candidatus Woesearchaeota archaeon]|nr:class I SAM-dependent methyltransferase [Candidatus Woesearchaeota archaeon]HIH31566.1 class I SAM-dependent methyltransferase [Candidatus Woesearchaeota archaeon]HIH54276.1 class I SAM-dependent methyltransferase [Candidatus Woesearchaeota archaeon]HIJ02534.1 class I SAM-dependent methyltransferase [Candidatus Woesearchaeota archaeon]HIJ13420.1 class I SAM-dependent methyltransferase [Candidatus Woesearchaeota archaeon]